MPVIKVMMSLIRNALSVVRLLLTSLIKLLQDEEVMKKKKEKLNKSKAQVASMDEASVVQRLMGLSLPSSTTDQGADDQVDRGTGGRLEVDTSLLFEGEGSVSETSEVLPYQGSGKRIKIGSPFWLGR